jgi:triacylglycerol esterase/lipase EstA (alpha/beta hydrolase family)
MRTEFVDGFPSFSSLLLSHGSHGLAEAHSAGLRQHPGERFFDLGLALARAAAGMAARTVEVVAHSMGGLVTCYFLSFPGPLSPGLLPNPVHKLITIGTPHQGTLLERAGN